MKKKARWLIMKILQQKKTKFVCENHNKYSWLMKLKLHITKKHAGYSWIFNYSFIQPSWWFPRTCPFSCDGSKRIQIYQQPFIVTNWIKSTHVLFIKIDSWQPCDEQYCSFIVFCATCAKYWMLRAISLKCIVMRKRNEVWYFVNPK